MRGSPVTPPRPPQDVTSIVDLVRRLTEAEAALSKAVAGADAVIDPDRGAPLLLSAAQNALRRSEARYNQLMARMAAIVFELEPDGVITYVNDAASTLTGFDADELIGQHWQGILFSGKGRRHVDALMARFQMDDVTGFELTLTTKSKGQLTLEINSANLYRSDGTLERVVGLGIDVTRRKKAERELGRYQRHLEELVNERTAQLQVANDALHRARAAEHEQRVLAEGLREIALRMMGILDLSDMLDSILTGVRSVVAYDGAELVLMGEDGKAYAADRRSYLSRSAAFSLFSADPFPLAQAPILQSMVDTHQPLIVSDILVDPDWARLSLPAWCCSCAAVPFMLGDEVIGFLILASSQAHFFTPTVVERLELLAHQVALAVQSVRLHQQARALAAAEERQRLARDLHDAVSQTLFAANVISESLRRQWMTNAHVSESQLDQLCQLTRGALAEMRMLLLELRPNALLEAGLDTLLRQLALSMQSRKQMEFSLDVGASIALPPEVKVCLFRIAQEALNNVVKHARASHVSVRLQQQADQIELEVADDGQGFDTAVVEASSLGLRIMRERALEAGVRLTICSAPGEGTHILVQWTDHPNSDTGAQDARHT